MKTWEKPAVQELGVQSTEFGPEQSPNVDAHYTDSKGDSLWSFS